MLDKLCKGNSDAVVIAHGRPQAGEDSLGRDLSNTTTAQTETTRTVLVVVSAPTFNRTPDKYPVACVDRYDIGDGSAPFHDSNVVRVAKPVFVAKKVS